MRSRFLQLPILAAVLACSSLAAGAVQVSLDSPDKNTTWPSAKPTRRDLRWNEKAQVLCATVVFDDSLHSDSTTAAAEDELTFTFPGTSYDPADQTVGVAGPDGQRIPIGEWRKAFLGKRFLLYQNTLIMMHRNRGAVTLTLDVDTERKAEQIRKKQEAEETETISLDSLIHPKN